MVTNTAALLNDAETVIVLAGAGMSKELGIPTYWSGGSMRYADNVTYHGYTALQHASAPLWQIDPDSQVKYFSEMYTEMLHLQAENIENSSYAKLLSWLIANNKKYFVVTSNVDSAFINAGYDIDRLFEVHGSYRTSQCLTDSTHPLFLTDVTVLNTPCPECGGIGRPNALFFEDFSFNPTQTLQQQHLFKQFQETLVEQKAVLLEIGVGITVPRVREVGNKLHWKYNLPFVHVNPVKNDYRSVFNLLMSGNAPTAAEEWVLSSTPEAFQHLGIV